MKATFEHFLTFRLTVLHQVKNITQYFHTWNLFYSYTYRNNDIFPKMKAYHTFIFTDTVKMQNAKFYEPKF